MAIVFDNKYIKDFISEAELAAISPQLSAAHCCLHNATGQGCEYTGWLHLPSNYDKSEFEQIIDTAEKIRHDSDILIVIGIGGSYLGARSIIELLKSPYHNTLDKNSPNIYFVGNDLCSSHILDILKICQDKDISVNVISKSGTTTEPAIAFKLFKDFMYQKYGKIEASKRIYCTTDKLKGVLKQMSEEQNFKTFVVPDDIGGRYSVLTAVGLLPVAVAGVDIRNLMYGAGLAEQALNVDDVFENSCYQYASVRNILYRKGKSIEILASYSPYFQLVGEWFKQLFAESEGKDQKGIFPVSLTYSTDLHSLGQYIQDGRRSIFETVLHLRKKPSDFVLNFDSEVIDSFKFLSNKTINFVNDKAFEATVLAHVAGGVPNCVLEIPELNEREVGYMVYFFEKACAISAYLLAVNPFNQPGVESYKKNMFALLGKPGYEHVKIKT